MSFKSFDVTEDPITQQQIDEHSSWARLRLVHEALYAFVYVAMSVSIFMAFHEPGLITVSLTLLLIAAAGGCAKHCTVRAMAREKLAVVDEHYLEKLALLFDEDLAPAVVRYRNQVSSQSREFCVGEYEALNSYNFHWHRELYEFSQLEKLKTKVYSAAGSGH